MLAERAPPHLHRLGDWPEASGTQPHAEPPCIVERARTSAAEIAGLCPAAKADRRLRFGA